MWDKTPCHVVAQKLIWDCDVFHEFFGHRFHHHDHFYTRRLRSKNHWCMLSRFQWIWCQIVKELVKCVLGMMDCCHDLWQDTVSKTFSKAMAAPVLCQPLLQFILNQWLVKMNPTQCTKCMFSETNEMIYLVLALSGQDTWRLMLQSRWYQLKCAWIHHERRPGNQTRVNM